MELYSDHRVILKVKYNENYLKYISKQIYIIIFYLLKKKKYLLLLSELCTIREFHYYNSSSYIRWLVIIYFIGRVLQKKMSLKKNLDKKGHDQAKTHNEKLGIMEPANGFWLKIFNVY